MFLLVDASVGRLDGVTSGRILQPCSPRPASSVHVPGRLVPLVRRWTVNNEDASSGKQYSYYRRIEASQVARGGGGAAGMEGGGVDSDGRKFRNADQMWKEEIGGKGDLCGGDKRNNWYRKGIEYWEGIEASVDGVLGGFGCLNEIDVEGSDGFLKTLLPKRFGAEKRHLVALDCGSGVGRVTKNLLLRHFNEVDLLEPVSHFLEAARKSLSPEHDIVNDAHAAANFYCIPLQEFTPESERYDVIWVQWCIGHLTDDDFVSFFKRAKAGLKPNGVFVLKENIAKSGFVLDRDDNSITRSDVYFRQLFNTCGLHLLTTMDQKGIPGELFSVKMYALSAEKPGQRMPAVIRSLRGR